MPSSVTAYMQQYRDTQIADFEQSRYPSAFSSMEVDTGTSRINSFPISRLRKYTPQTIQAPVAAVGCHVCGVSDGISSCSHCFRQHLLSHDIVILGNISDSSECTRTAGTTTIDDVEYMSVLSGDLKDAGKAPTQSKTPKIDPILEQRIESVLSSSSTNIIVAATPRVLSECGILSMINDMKDDNDNVIVCSFAGRSRTFHIVDPDVVSRACQFSQYRSLSRILTKYQKEHADDGDNIKEIPLRKCCFCPAKFPSKSLVACIDHMYTVHSLNLGRYVNLVFIEELLQMVEHYVSDVHVCIYCERPFPDRASLRHHMKTRNHTSPNPKNPAFDRFYLSSYVADAFLPEDLECSSTSSDSESDDDVHSGDGDDETWDDWNDDVVDDIDHAPFDVSTLPFCIGCCHCNDASQCETEANDVYVCLYCPAPFNDVQSCIDHMADVHHVTIDVLKSNVNANDEYGLIKVFNFIRRRIYDRKCVHCNECFKSNGSGIDACRSSLITLLNHMEQQCSHDPIAIKSASADMIFDASLLFPVFENDAMLTYCASIMMNDMNSVPENWAHADVEDEAVVMDDLRNVMTGITDEVYDILSSMSRRVPHPSDVRAAFYTK